MNRIIKAPKEAKGLKLVGLSVTNEKGKVIGKIVEQQEQFGEIYLKIKMNKEHNKDFFGEINLPKEFKENK